MEVQIVVWRFGESRQINFIGNRKFEVDGDIMKNIKVKKTVYIVLVILGLFIAQTFASKLGGFIADLIQYAVIDKDGTFMSIVAPILA